MELSNLLTKRLLAWYDRGHRDLPWRNQPIPYYVWVSEIMLQQTRVEAVKPYFARFIAALPDIPALASAEEEILLKLWEGLGYYRRVYHLQKAARIVMERHQGQLPDSYPQLRELPGIGDYTAGAIASIAFGHPKAAVDGNVLRVITRLTADYRDISGMAIKKEISGALEKIYPQKRCGDFTQSLMELGAMVCLPGGTPKCEICPLSDLCLANLTHATDELPVKPQKKKRKIQKLAVLILRYQNRIAIEKRTESGLLQGLWQLPNFPNEGKSQTPQDYLQEQGVVFEKITPALQKKHIFTHVEWEMSSYLVTCTDPGTAFRWVTPEELKRDVSLPSAFQHFSSLWER